MEQTAVIQQQNEILLNRRENIDCQDNDWTEVKGDWCILDDSNDRQIFG